MTASLALTLLLACSSSEAPAPTAVSSGSTSPGSTSPSSTSSGGVPPDAVYPAPAVDHDLRPGGPGAREVIRLLDRVGEMSLELSPDNLGPDADVPQRFVLDSGWRLAPRPPGEDASGQELWVHPSPLDLPQKRHSRAPTGMELRAGDESLHFDAMAVMEPRARRWALHRDAIYLRSRLDPGRWPVPPAVVRAGPGLREAPLNLERSGQAPADFAVQQLSLGADTRRCLYLPAPSTAALRLTLPAQAPALRFAVGIAETEEAATASARFDLSVQPADGPAVVLGGVLAASDSGWVEDEADLSPWAGQEVTLRLSTDPLGDPTRDYLCVATPEVTGAPPADADPVRIVVVGVDTLRADRLGLAGYPRDTSPELDLLGRTSVRFPRAWAPAPRTRPSFRTATTGRWPLRAITAPTFGEVLRAQGFATAGIVANVHLAPRLGFSDGFDAWHYDNGALADDQVDRAMGWLEDHAAEDSFLFLHIMDPHIFYMAPGDWRDRFTEGLDRGDLPDQYNRWLVAGWEELGQLSEEEKTWIEGRYDGEVAWTSHQLGRLLEGIDALPGRSLVVLHTDHGEEFWEHGGFEHNHSLYDELTRALLWFRLPGGAGAQPLDHPASLADLAPTLYEAVGVPPAQRPETDGTSLWPLMDAGELARAAATGQALDSRPLHLGYLMFDTERWGVVARDEAGTLHKYVLHTADGRSELYDLDADPGEQTDLAAVEGFDPTPWLARLSAATSWPAGMGWRLRVRGLQRPVTFRFAAPVQAAGILDPEVFSTRRANLEWGEVPVVRPEHVGTSTLSEDGRRLTFTPATGPEATDEGTLYVLAAATDARSADLLEGTVVDGTDARPLHEGVDLIGGGSLSASWGPLLVPTETEAAALAAASDDQTDDSSDAQLEALRALGYIGD